MNGTTTTVVEPTTFVFLTIQSTTSTKMVISLQDTFTALSIKSINTTETLLREISMIMTHPVLSASWRHVVQCWWCPQGMTVHLDGLKSIMGIWWLNIMVTDIQEISSVLMVIQNTFLVAVLAKMVPCCMLWKAFVVHFPVFHMSAVESWHAPSAPSNERKKKAWTVVDLH